MALLGRIQSTLGRDQIILVSLAIAYVLTGRMGFEFNFDHPAISLIFAPSGIALGAYLVLGYMRVWPVVLFSAVLLYSSVLGVVPAAGIMAAAVTAEGMLAAYLVNRFAGGRQALQTPRHAMRFAGLTLLTSVCGSATVSVAALVALGALPVASIDVAWISHAMGSYAGTIMATPLVLLLVQGTPARWKKVQLIEALAVAVAVFATGLVVFCDVPGDLRGYPTEMLCFVVLLWPAFRLGRRATSLAILLLFGLALFGTLHNTGPLVRTSPTESLMMVVLYMTVIAALVQALAALAAEYSDAAAQLNELVLTDPMTGLPNYRHLVEVMNQEIARANKADAVFAVVFCDMDGLKQINDELGHLIGTRAVCRFADTLKASVRSDSGDTAARYGGDEFVAVLPNCDEAGAQKVIDRLTQRLVEDKVKPELATSAGVAVYPRDGSTATTLLAAADRALYAVKAQKASRRRRGVVPISEWTTSVAR
jgi:diguanylate cyclase (GGDEF)-like protein